MFSMGAGVILAGLISIGQAAGVVTLDDELGKKHVLPEAGQPLLVVYEDQDGGKQNKATKALIGAYNDPLPNRAKLTVWPVADLSKWNWWPAKGHATKDVKKSAEQSNTHILIDWTGALHKAWGLKKGKNSIILVGADGKVRFSSEGEQSTEQRTALEAELKALGLER